MFHPLVLLLVVIKYTSAFEDSNPVVSMSSGEVQGILGRTVNRYVEYYSFKGIPFAEKPIGKLRFEPPVKNLPWEGVLDASQDKDECTQFNSEGTAIVGSEDCLYLSVYTTNNPTGSNNKLLPVMIYISGGYFQRGSSKYEDYPPDYFLEKGVIYVGMNYRLGIFGFLCTEDMVVPGNVGLKDQILAIQWVRENIKYFGGDPDRITVFGQSAGAVSVSYLLQSRLTKGFFKQAIMQSGTSLCVWALNSSPREQAFKVGQLLQINATDTKTLVDNLRKVDYMALKTAEFQITNRETVEHFIRGLPFGVAHEPDYPGAVFSIRSKSHLQLTKKEFPKIPILLGFTSNEAALYTDQIQFFNSTLASYDANVSKIAPTGIVKDSTKRELAGRKIKNHYFGNETIVSQPTKFIEFFTIDGFKRPIRESARLFKAVKNSRIFFYQFGYIGNLGTSNRNYKGEIVISKLDNQNYY
ncbi:unnamed protein product [Ceutorhynchus assimilis]|uniref:Carboxylic ester hydrolase n=1 Tax=Ceutorhynchus assimilis TaxID=467358 RepID=A0A9N9MGY7_9CUCU|nr:unnamed protein product [Ceutorhynchus assimilis]